MPLLIIFNDDNYNKIKTYIWMYVGVWVNIICVCMCSNLNIIVWQKRQEGSNERNILINRGELQRVYDQHCER